MPSRFLLSAVALVALVHPPLSAQSSDVDSYLKAEIAKYHIPGLSVVVARNGVIVKQSSYGFASLEFSVPATNQTLYQIASATKSFTAAAVMMLVDQGKFKSTDSITKLLPGLPDRWSGVTVRHLLSHTSGLPDLLAVPGRGPLLFTSHKEAMDSLPNLPLAGVPGEKWLYNQTNYLLLLDLVEKYGGEGFTSFIRHRIFEPLRMTASVFDSRTVVPNYATHYATDDSGKVRRTLNDVAIYPFLYSAAGIGTTATELYYFAEALRSQQLIRPESIEEMWTPVVRNDGKTVIEAGTFSIEYGYGFVVDRRPGFRSFGHSGGGNAAFRIFPDDKMVVVVLHNGQTPIPDMLVFGVAGKYNPALNAAFAPK